MSYIIKKTSIITLEIAYWLNKIGYITNIKNGYITISKEE